jgi:NAD-dependent dihydropyrimidine dehydrogenase PreA subunit
VIPAEKVDVAFPHWLGRLVVLKEGATCPLCGHCAMVWVERAQPTEEFDTCLGCAAIAQECPGCAIRMTPKEAKRGWCDGCEREKFDQEHSFDGGGR